MIGRSNMLPVAMVVVIAFLTLIAITSGRTNDPGVVGDSNYPHYICTFNEYCEADECSREPRSFVLYLEHIDQNPRLEIAGVNPDVSLTSTPDLREFETRGGDLRGVLTMFPDRQINWVATSGIASDPVEHFATGDCERLRTP